MECVLFWEQLSCPPWHRRKEQGHNEVKEGVVTVGGRRDAGKPGSLWHGGTWH